MLSAINGLTLPSAITQVIVGVKFSRICSMVEATLKFIVKSGDIRLVASINQRVTVRFHGRVIKTHINK
jgi:hypothetical protein